MRTQDLTVGVNNQPILYTVLTKLDPTLGNIPFSLLGLTFQFVVKKNATDPDSSAVVILTSAGGDIVVTDATNGKMNVQVSPAATGTKGKYAYRLDALTGVRPTTVLRGAFTVEAV